MHNSSPLNIDFLSAKQCYRRQHTSKNSSLLAKALSAKNALQNGWQIIDATAGLGTDAFLIASWGIDVIMLERSVEIASLLEDALERASELIKINDMHLKLINTDAKIYLSKISQLHPKQRPEIIYLDPMYPDNKKTALNKKDLRSLAKLVGKDEDADELLPLALKAATKRVVVKRSRHAPLLANLKPNTIFHGNTTRFDVYLAISTDFI